VIPEIGHFALVLAFLLAVALCVLPLAGAQRRDAVLIGSAPVLAIGVLALVAVAFGCLVYAFVNDDFSVAYVANNSNTRLPLQFRVSALWGAHEGSFLLWILIMAAWTVAVAAGSRALPPSLVARVLGVMGGLSAGFIAFSLLTSNPFARALPMPPVEGSDLNPLLQDFGLIVHPPILYAGYVGFSVPFAFAVAALLTGRLDAAWARWSRPWTNLAWALLTVGIALGSWWAYYELGWGGWWFWDPVENASFMPWLVGTALVHSLAVTEKRGVFKSWTVLLAIATFSLSLLGAFIVRSGVLTSVHAFAVDPERGLFILGFLAVVVGGSLTLYAVRAPVIRSRAQFGGLSREVLLLVNNLLLTLAVSVVLLGTLFPLAYEALRDGAKISVGPPYFNGVFLPIMVALAVVLGLGPAAHWKKTDPRALVRTLGPVLAVSLVCGVAIPLVAAGAVNPALMLGVALAAWIVLAQLVDLRRRARTWADVLRLPAAYVGMAVAHVGFAMSIAGVVVTHQLSIEQDVRLTTGASTRLGALTLTLVSVEQVTGANYLAQQATVRVDGDGAPYLLRPEKRRYLAGGNIMTEAAIEPGFGRDVYVALGEPIEGGGWALRAQYKPLVRWVWFGALLMAAGGVLAVMDPRYRRLRRPRVVRSGEAVAGAAT
jgi:cytochrome c-type biogenesis protein CcmF